MSRFRRAFHSIASSYVSLLVAGVCSLGSVPLALHYLSKEKFALWALMSGIGNYLNLIDLGMSGAVARLLIDHKDEPGRGTYGSLIKTGWLVLLVQGGIVFAVGFGLAPELSHVFMTDEPELASDFMALLQWQSATWGLSFVLRIFSHVLQAHQRMDISNHATSVLLLLNLGLQWYFFQMGQGVFSLVWANVINVSLGGVIAYVACWRLGMFPPAGAWGRASWRYFREMFDYGKDIFLVGVGAQLIIASQVFIIKLDLTLEAVAAWQVGTKAFTLLSQLIWRIFDTAGPAFSEMVVRGERTLLLQRYRSMVILTASFSVFAAAGYAACNSQFVWIYSGGKFNWPVLNDVLLAAWMVVMATLHCHNGFVLLTKKIGFMRYLFFVEGLVFVAAAMLVTKWGGMPAMVGCSVVCSTFFSGAYGVWRVSRYFNLSFREVAFHWLTPTVRFSLLFLPVAAVVFLATRLIHQPTARFGLNFLMIGGIGSYLFLRHGLPQTFQRELLHRSPNAINPFLKRVFPAT